MVRAAVRVRNVMNPRPEGWDQWASWADTAAMTDSSGVARFVTVASGRYRVRAMGDYTYPGEVGVDVTGVGSDTVLVRLQWKLPYVMKFPQHAERLHLPWVRLLIGWTRSLATLRSGDSVSAEVLVSKTPRGWPADTDWWGVDWMYSRRPGLVVRSLRCVERGETLRLPFSTYFNLGEPRRFRIEGDSVGSVITIEGGAGNAYVARWWIRDGKLTRSRVELAEFPDGKFQETIWLDEAVDD